MIYVNVTNLYNLTIHHRYVDPALILDESKDLYKALKLEGTEGVDVVYEEHGKKDWYINLPIETKAFSAFVMILYMRWKDGENDARLAYHYNLPLPVVQILDTKSLTEEKVDSSSHSFVSIRSIIKNYLKI